MKRLLLLLALVALVGVAEAQRLPGGIRIVKPAAPAEPPGDCTYPHPEGFPSMDYGDCFPDENSTGVQDGVEFTATHEFLDSTSNGQTIENIIIDGGYIRVEHNNVTIRNVLCQTDWPCIRINLGGVNTNTNTSGTLIEYVTFDGTGVTGGGSSLDFQDYEIRFSKCFDYVECFGVHGGVFAHDNLIYMMLDGVVLTGCEDPDCPHADGMQGEFGEDVTIEHNTIIMDNPHVSSIIQMGDQVGNSNNWGRYNLVSAGSGTLWTWGGTSSGVAHNYVLDGSTHAQMKIMNGGFNGNATECGTRWLNGASAGQLLSGSSAC